MTVVEFAAAITVVGICVGGGFALGRATCPEPQVQVADVPDCGDRPIVRIGNRYLCVRSAE